MSALVKVNETADQVVATTVANKSVDYGRK
jgi:hypothetical protein